MKPASRLPGIAAALGAVWFGFLLFGQRFWDDDYGLWLNPAIGASYGDLIGGLLRPFPADWGFSDRPLPLLLFRIGHDVFGASAAIFFAAKAVAAGVVVGAIAAAGRTLGVAAGFDPRRAAISGAAAALLFATAEPVFASLLWLNDVEIVAQALVLLSLLLYARLVSQTSPSAAGRLLLLVVALIAFKTKPSAKVLPLLLAIDLLAFRRSHLRSLGPLVGLLVAANVPWTVLPLQPLPGVFDPPTPGALTWHAPAVELYDRLLVGRLRAWPFTSDGLRLGLSSFLLPFALPLLVGVRWLRSPLGGLVAGWLVLELVLLGCYPDIPPHLIQRYLLGSILPLCLVLGLGVGGVRGRLRGVVVVLVLLQVAAGVHGSSLRKRSQGCQIAIQDQTRERLEDENHGVDIVLLDLPDNGQLGDPRNRYHSVASNRPQDTARVEVLVRSGPTLLVSEKEVRSPRWRHRWTERPTPAGYWALFGPPLGRCERSVYAGL
jgi:hypothetical protein